VANCIARRLAVVCLLLGGACAPAAPVLPTPPPRPLPVLVTPGAAAEANTWLAGYAAVNGLQSFDLEIEPPQEAQRKLEAGQASLLIGALLPPDGWFATPLTYEPLAIVLSRDVSVRNLSLEQLRQIFAGQVQSWQDVGGAPRSIQPVIAPQGDDIRRAFEAAVMDGEPITPNAMLAPTPEAVLEMVGRQMGAIGILPFSQAGDASVARLDGASPSGDEAGRYPLMLQIIAMAPRSPGPEVAAWLAWLQSQGTPTPAPVQAIPSPVPTATAS
jgi:hypothetical protein